MGCQDSDLPFLNTVGMPTATVRCTLGCTLHICCTRPDGSPAAGLPYKVILSSEKDDLKGTLDAQGHVSYKNLPIVPATVELGERVDEEKLKKVREEIKDVLNRIIQEEKKEAEKIAEEFDKKSTIGQAFSLFGSFLAGFAEAVGDAVEFVVDVADFLVPIDNAFQAAWKAYNGEDGKWIDTFVKEFSDSHYQDLVDALGFDPAKIKKEDFAKAYEIANHIYDDAPTREILANFAVDYVGAQHVTEVAQFSGGMAFEIVLIALLVIATGGVGAAVSIRHVGKLKKLGSLFEKLGGLLKKKKRHRIDDQGNSDRIVDEKLDKSKRVELANAIELEPGEKGGWNKQLNGDLEPNKKYKVGDYLYDTDEHGRVKKVSGSLELNTRDRNQYQQGKSAKEGGIKDGLSDDDGGHLIASIFDGAGEQINYVPMNSNLNRSGWKKMENKWADALKEGKEVKIDIQPIYNSNSKRPEEFKVDYWIDGKKKSVFFENKLGG